MAKGISNTGKSYTSTDDKMSFGDYLDLISTKPTQLRMFLFNIFKHIPDLCQDFNYPDIVDYYVKKHPFMFFGGATSKVDAHFDLDLSHVFLTQFFGKKRVVLFAPEYSTHLYRHPLTVSCNVDLGNPDFDKYPKLLDAKGYECEISDGETLFIPSGYWHYIHYTEGGFALSLRARATHISKLARAGFQMFNLLFVDYNMSRLLGAKRWYAMKEQMAVKRANKL
ncbi:MAG: cupin-like domain-containing protein [Legionellales bacterium]